MQFQREKQRISAGEILGAIANGDDIKLYRCTISGELDINRLFEKDENFDTSNLALRQDQAEKVLTLSQSIVFRSCVFEENVVFSPPWAEPDTIRVIFEQDVSFNSSVFNNQVSFGGAVFHGLAGFDGCSFDSVGSFRAVTFRSRAMFRTAVFKGYCLLNDAVFQSQARFSNSFFAKGVNFMRTRFEGGTDFAGVYSGSRAVPIHDSIFFGRRRYGDDESFWRFVKQTAQEAGHYQLAGESFYQERCAHLRGKFKGSDYDSISAAKKFSRLIGGVRLIPEILFGKYLFGYGERPTRVLVASVLLIFVCAGLYGNLGVLLYKAQPFE